jgi:hypothetical protein
MKNHKYYKILVNLFICATILSSPSSNAEFFNRSPSIMLAKKIKQDPAAKKLEFKVLNLALQSYIKAKNDHSLKHKLNNNYLTIVDYSLPSTERRLWVIDLINNRVLINTLVAHGKNSGNNVAKKFSDIPESRMSSIGVFVTGKQYIGKHGLSMRLHGLEKNFNANAYSRAIVMHSASYVNERLANKHGRIGRSFGCLAVNQQIIKDLINTVKNGTLVFSYYPEPKWLQNSSFL